MCTVQRCLHSVNIPFWVFPTLSQDSIWLLINIPVRSRSYKLYLLTQIRSKWAGKWNNISNEYFGLLSFIIKKSSLKLRCFFKVVFWWDVSSILGTVTLPSFFRLLSLRDLQKKCFFYDLIFTYSPLFVK